MAYIDPTERAAKRLGWPEGHVRAEPGPQVP